MSTSIEWSQNPDGSAGETWNPIRARNLETGKVGWHCEKISAGCTHCYSATQNEAGFRGGTLFPYIAASRPKVEIFLDQKALTKPLHWKKPRGIFVCSMSDWCAEFVTDDWQNQIVAVAGLCQQHRFIFLTKRADRLLATVKRLARSINPLEAAARSLGYTFQFRGLGGGTHALLAWPIRSMRLGVSIENEEWAEKRLPVVCELGEAGWNTMVSVEPMLGPVVLPERLLKLGKSTWVIVGGESGRDARPFDIAWARSVIEQCQAAGVPVFCKQLGANVQLERYLEFDYRSEFFQKHGNKAIRLKDRKGGDPLEWPADLRVRELPTAGGAR